MNNKRAADAIEASVTAENFNLLASTSVTTGYVFKIPDPVKITRNLGKGKIEGRKIKQVFVDYCGIINGRPIAFEAKKTEAKTSWSFSELGKVNPAYLGPQSQIDRLKLFALSGGIAAVYLWRFNGGRFQKYWIPITSEGVIGGVADRKSITWAVAEKYQVPVHLPWYHSTSFQKQEKL